MRTIAPLSHCEPAKQSQLGKNRTLAALAHARQVFTTLRLLRKLAMTRGQDVLREAFTHIEPTLPQGSGDCFVDAGRLLAMTGGVETFRGRVNGTGPYPPALCAAPFEGGPHWDSPFWRAPSFTLFPGREFPSCAISWRRRDLLAFALPDDAGTFFRYNGAKASW